MKKFLLTNLLLICCVTLFAQAKVTNEEIIDRISKGKPFTLVFLKAGDVKPSVDVDIRQMQMDHLANLFQMEKDGKISVFGPINNDTMLRGIIIFNTTDKDIIKKELNKDPFVKNGYMKFDLLEWFSIPGQKLPGT